MGAVFMMNIYKVKRDKCQNNGPMESTFVVVSVEMIDG